MCGQRNYYINAMLSNRSVEVNRNRKMIRNPIDKAALDYSSGTL